MYSDYKFIVLNFSSEKYIFFCAAIEKIFYTSCLKINFLNLYFKEFLEKRTLWDPLDIVF